MYLSVWETNNTLSFREESCRKTRLRGMIDSDNYEVKPEEMKESNNGIC